MKKKSTYLTTPSNGVFSPQTKHKIPESSGVYIYKDSSETILYIGKAKNLRKRVSSYFTKTPIYLKTHLLVQQISIIDIILVETESEALFLEATLIKKNLPKFNINFKDGKFYPYIKITINEEYPRILITRNKYNDGNRYFGPYISASSVRLIVEILQKTFQLRTCKSLPKKSCLEFHMGRCSAPCIQNISQKNYLASLDSVLQFLSGDHNSLINELSQKMKKASKELLFEKAHLYKEQLDALISLEQKQHVYLSSDQNIDIIGMYVQGAQSSIVVAQIRQGKLSGKEGFLVEKENKNDVVFSPSETLEEFIINRYTECTILPHKIYINHMYTEIISEVVDWLHEDDISLNIQPISDSLSQEHALLLLTEKNARLHLEQSISEPDILQTLSQLQEQLSLSEFPSIIEGFDIAKLDGTLASGVMVQFKGGIAYKKGYRMFNIHAKNQQDDYIAIEEIVYRRYQRLIKEQQPLPKLIIIDGGKGQLNAALKSLKKLNLTIDIISIAKAHEELFIPNQSDGILLQKNSSVLHLIQNIRDESHRFSQHHLHQRMKKKMES